MNDRDKIILRLVKRIVGLEDQIRKVRDTHGPKKANLFAKSILRHIEQLKGQLVGKVEEYY